MKKGKYTGFFVIGLAALVVYFIYQKAKPMGGVTVTPTMPFGGPGPGGTYSQVG